MSANDAAVGLYCGWIGVVGVLKIKFAKTIARGVGTVGVMQTHSWSYDHIGSIANVAEYHTWVW